MCFFVVLHVFKKQNLDRGRGWVGTGHSEFFSDFLIFFNLTRPLNVLIKTNHNQDWHLKGYLRL